VLCTDDARTVSHNTIYRVGRRKPGDLQGSEAFPPLDTRRRATTIDLSLARFRAPVPNEPEGVHPPGRRLALAGGAAGARSETRAAPRKQETQSRSNDVQGRRHTSKFVIARSSCDEAIQSAVAYGLLSGACHRGAFARPLAAMTGAFVRNKRHVAGNHRPPTQPARSAAAC